MNFQHFEHWIKRAIYFCSFLGLFGAGTACAMMNTPSSWSVSPGGAFTYEIPFRLPPGIAGVQPKLGLTYSSQSGNGLAGMGWNLSGLSVITRCPRTLAVDGIRGAVNMDSNDRLCLDGQRLILQTGTYGAEGATYATETYNGSRIVGTSLTGTVHTRTFKVYTKAGELMEYTPFNTPANNAALQFVLSRVTDAKGNYWQVYYQTDIAQGEIYPKAVCYTGNSRLNQAPKSCIEFGYGSEANRYGVSAVRSDKSLAYMAGFAMRNNQRLSGVRTLINATATVNGNSWTVSGTQVTEYRLSYESLYGTVGKTLLRSIQECVNTSCLPEVVFARKAFKSGGFLSPELRIANYGHAAGGWLNSSEYPRQLVDVNGDGLPDILGFAANGVIVSLNTGMAFSSPQVWIAYFGTQTGGWLDTDMHPREVADVNGDGLPDIVGFASNGVQVSLNNGTSFLPAQLWVANYGYAAGGWLNSSEYPRQLVDVNDDGLPDVLGFAANGVIVSLNTGIAFSSPQVWTAYFGTKTGGWLDTNVHPRKVVDVNGDRLPDIVGFASNGVQVSLNNGTSFLPAQLWVANYGYAAGGWLNSSEYPRQLVDVNGDGLPDILGFAANGVIVSLNTGIAFSSPQVWIAYFGTQTGGWLDTNVHPREVADVNGDGLPDIVGFASNGVQVSLNNGTSFLPAQLWVANYGYAAGGWLNSSEYPRQLSDVNGDGLTDVVGFSLSGVMVSLERSSDLMPMGAIISVNQGSNPINIRYRSIINWHGYTARKNPAKSSFPWFHIDSPFYVAAEIIQNPDSQTQKLVSKFSYGDLRVEVGTGRGFLGFEWMESQMTGSDGIAGPVSRTTFAQQWPCIGMPLQSQTKLPGGGLKSQSDNTIRVRTPSNATPQSCGSSALNGQIVIPFVQDSITRQWEMTTTAQQGAELPRNRTTTTLDSYGNPTHIQEQTLNPDGTDSSYSRTTTNTYDSNAERTRQGRLIKSTVTHTKP